MKTQHTTKNITPAKVTLEVLKRDFTHCFDKDGNFDIEKLKREISGADVNFSNESYGMDWLGKSYARVRATDPATTLLKEDITWNTKEENKNSENLLIKGDNLEVLKHLSHAYHEQVKMIYIDPPYNTGTDGFVYEDDRKFTPEEFTELAGVDLEQAKRILDFVDSKSNSHSAWLSFMYPRLYIARQLLKDDGVIFVSIDDNEVAQLRILMNEVFGEQNLLSALVWDLGTGPQAGHFTRSHEHLLCYAKVKSQVKNFSGGEGEIDHSALKKISTKNPASSFIFPAGTKFEAPDGYELTGAWGGSERTELISGRMICKNGVLSESVTLRAGWAMKTQMESFFNNQQTFDSKGQKVTDFYFNSSGVLKYKKERSVINPKTVFDSLGSTKTGSDEVSALLGAECFDYPKPSRLLSFLVSLVTDSEGSLVLDFFAGSGTTADAVFQLNTQDGGNRRFLLVQLPEKIKSTDNKVAYDFVNKELKINEPTIFDITKERLVRAAKKIKEEHIDSEHIASVDFGFKIFETVPLWDGYVDEPAEYDNNLKIFDVAKLKDNDIATLLTTWKTYDAIPLTTPLTEVDLGGYAGYYNDNKLYLVHAGFTAKHLTALLKLIDTDTTFSPATIIIFGYHFDSARMRELAENVKSYANKKSIDIECVTRY